MLKALRENINNVIRSINIAKIFRALRIIVNRVNRDSTQRESELT